MLKKRLKGGREIRRKRFTPEQIMTILRKAKVALAGVR
jgi:hypothetical protein